VPIGEASMLIQGNTQNLSCGMFISMLPILELL
jgi:hypothetical protein